MKKLLIVLTAFTLITFGTSSSQLKYGRIDGKVVANEGMLLPGVPVTLGSELFPIRTAVTSKTGDFSFHNLDPGLYKLSFELPGFVKEVRERIMVHVGNTLSFNISMNRATLEEGVTVKAETAKRKHLLEEMNWKEAKEAFSRYNMAILP